MGLIQFSSNVFVQHHWRFYVVAYKGSFPCKNMSCLPSCHSILMFYVFTFYIISYGDVHWYERQSHTILDGLMDFCLLPEAVSCDKLRELG